MNKLDHALALAAAGFHLFPLRPGGKKPLHKGWQNEATRDPAQLRGWFDDATPTCPNIGIFTSKFGDDAALVVVDVDNKGVKRGSDELVRLELAGFDLPPTRTYATPTGGRHLVFRAVRPVRQGANVLGDGLDIRSKGGYIVAPGSVVPAGEYIVHADVAVVDAPDWLIERCGSARSRISEASPLVPAAVPADVDKDRALRRAREFLVRDAALAVEGAGGDQTTYRVAARLKDFGLSEQDAAALMLAEWNHRCSPPWDSADLLAKVGNAYRYGFEAPGVAAPETDFRPVEAAAEQVVGQRHPFDVLNKEFAFVIAGGGSHILWETVDEHERYKLEHLTEAAFHKKFASRKIQVGKKTNPVTMEWMEWDGRRSFDGVVFMPQLQAPKRFYNLWRGFAYEPCAADETLPAEATAAFNAFIEHTQENICRGSRPLFNWLMGYFAHLIQKPWEKPLVALVFRGGKGVGKNACIETIGALLGHHFFLTSNRRYLVSNFTGHLENCLLFVLDEAFWSGDKQAEGTVKDLITGKYHVIEHKGKEPYSVDNRTRVVIIGNEDWLVPASHDERRFAVFDVGEGRKQDRAFFQAMRRGMELGGYRLLLRHLLQERPAGGSEINAAPSTSALLDQKLSSLDSVQQWWLACLTEGRVASSDFGEGWPQDVDCERFRAALRRYIKDRNIRSRVPDDRVIGRDLRACVPGMKHTRVRAGGPYVYKLPPLAECRAAWSRFIGHDAEWPE